MTTLHIPKSLLAINALRGLTCAGVLLLVGCGSGDGPMTLGDYCSQLAGPTCDRAIECDMGPASDRSGCLAAFKDGCCAEAGRCGEEVPSKEAEERLKRYISSCSAAFDNFSCTSLDAGKVPDACDPDSYSALAPVSPKDLGRLLRPR
jgi:hypothetical protein